MFCPTCQFPAESETKRERLLATSEEPERPFSQRGLRFAGIGLASVFAVYLTVALPFGPSIGYLLAMFWLFEFILFWSLFPACRIIGFGEPDPADCVRLGGTMTGIWFLAVLIVAFFVRPASATAAILGFLKVLPGAVVLGGFAYCVELDAPYPSALLVYVTHNLMCFVLTALAAVALTAMLAVCWAVFGGDPWLGLHFH